MMTAPGQMLLLASALKLIAETALMAFLGRWVLGRLAGPRRHGNVFYRLLVGLTEHFVKAARRLPPRGLPERLRPRMAVLMLAALWVAALLWKIDACLAQGCLAQARP